MDFNKAYWLLAYGSNLALESSSMAIGYAINQNPNSEIALLIAGIAAAQIAIWKELTDVINGITEGDWKPQQKIADDDAITKEMLPETTQQNPTELD